ncbi:GntR family transcriptional regulator [Streptacidiphilus sp. MAP12-33]|uniref:winged helix-turn-helix domain-containing protein n=1 Tax=Streptacidiphilus sp. MAP12-33 TaxID=3156266 RepID=UPI0035179F3A
MVDWSGKPAYQQVSEDLRARIAAGEFDAAGRIPSLSQLEQRYDVSVTVIRSAVAQLREAGLVKSHQGKAAFLVPDAAAIAAKSLPPADLDQLRGEVAALRTEVQDLRARVAELEGR